MRLRCGIGKESGEQNMSDDSVYGLLAQMACVWNDEDGVIVQFPFASIVSFFIIMSATSCGSPLDAQSPTLNGIDVGIDVTI